MGSPLERVRDAREVVEDLLDHVLVLRHRRAQVADWSARGVRRYPRSTDPDVHAELWSQVPGAEWTLWAYRARHRAYPVRFARATLRERDHAGGAVARNSTLAGRLPRRMREAKHREAVLACIAELRSALAG